MSDSGPKLRVAVISDLHAYLAPRAGHITPSSLDCTATVDPRTDPLEGIRALASSGLAVDFLLCCGDLADRAEVAATREIWRRLPHVRDALGARAIIATCGNHDVDSRFTTNSYDPIEALRDLDSFPTPFDDATAHYWAYHYAVCDFDDCRIVTLNSSAYHTVASEVERGRIAAPTVARLIKDLNGRSPKPVNLILTHHHPHKYGDIVMEDNSDMLGASLLLDTLGSGLYGEWLVIHGHRHFPWLSYAAGGASSPVVFAAGSLAFEPLPAYPKQTARQFYVLELGWEDADTWAGGRYTAWNWSEGQGWVRPSSDGGLPPEGGFGLRQRLADVAAKIGTEFADAGEPFLTWAEIEARIPNLRFLLPKDRSDVLEHLRRIHGFRVREGVMPSEDQLAQ